MKERERTSSIDPAPNWWMIRPILAVIDVSFWGFLYDLLFGEKPATEPPRKLCPSCLREGLELYPDKAVREAVQKRKVVVTPAFNWRCCVYCRSRSIHGGIERAIGAASAQPGSEPDSKNGTAFLTAENLAFLVSVSDDNGTRLLHVSFSRPDGILSMAVASRIAGLLVVMLSQNKAELSPQVPNAGVFHLSFRLATPTLIVKPFDEVQAIVAGQHPAVPFGGR